MRLAPLLIAAVAGCATGHRRAPAPVIGNWVAESAAPAEAPPVAEVRCYDSAQGATFVRPPGGASYGNLAPGTTFVVVSVSPDDAYCPDAATIVGASCWATAEMHESDPGWYAGDASCSNGSSYYFYGASITAVGRPAASGSDRDADGIDDSFDGCPDSPEDVDGDQDTDGCVE